MTFTVIDEIALPAEGARVYPEGWQSWSPTTWYRAGEAGHRPDQPWQHTMRFRPGTDLPRGSVQGEGLLVVDLGPGLAARTYGVAEARTAVPSIRAEVVDDVLLVSADGPVSTTAVPEGADAALARFGDSFARSARPEPLRPAPRVWCSWYRYFLDVTEHDVLHDLAAIDRHELPVDVVQVDDGWGEGIGEGCRLSDGFTSLPRLVEQIMATGRRAGIWLAPFLVGRQSQVAREHPDWLVGDAGANWEQDLVGLDLTHPGVQEHLRRALTDLREAGFDYYKLDFLYGGAVPGCRHEDVSPIEAYRSGLRLVRDVVGPDAFLVGCGAPVLPSVGLVDAMRVSPDTYHLEGRDGTGGLRGRMSAVARAWQQGRFWVNDPDCFVGRPSYPLREEWAAVVEQVGGLRSFSDRVDELDTWGLETARRLLAESPPAVPFASLPPAAAPVEGLG